MHQQKVTGRFKEVLEAAAMLVSSKVELIGGEVNLMVKFRIYFGESQKDLLMY